MSDQNHRVSTWTISIWRKAIPGSRNYEQAKWDPMATATTDFYAEDICAALRSQNKEVRLERDGVAVRYYPPWAEKNGKQG